MNLRRSDAERLCDLEHGREARVGLSALDAPVIASVDPALRRERLLRYAGRFARLRDRATGLVHRCGACPPADRQLAQLRASCDSCRRPTFPSCMMHQGPVYSPTDGNEDQTVKLGLRPCEERWFKTPLALASF
jgi:hypothetical protein